MASPSVNFRQLIDLAVGIPESGQVNLNALQCLLYSFAEELNVTEKEIDSTKFEKLQLEKVPSETAQASSEAAPEESVFEKQDIDKDISEEIAKEDIDSVKRIYDLEVLVKDLERKIDEGKPTETYNRGILIMKEQLELSMQQLLLVSALALEQRTDNLKLEQLKTQIGKLRSVQHENIYIGSLNLAEDGRSEFFNEFAFGEEFCAESAYEQGAESTSTTCKRSEKGYKMDLHLTYAPEKILYQLMEVKADYCLLSTKVNDIQAAVLKVDSDRIYMIFEQLQKQMGEINYLSALLKEAIERNQHQQDRLIESLRQVSQRIDALEVVKIDKETVDELLAEKADLKDLALKVSQDEMNQNVHCIEKKICELHVLNDLMERNFYRHIDELRISLGYNSIEDILASFKEKIQNDFKNMQKLLDRYIKATNDECAAAGTRVKVLQDVACISCDTACVIRTRERAKVAKFPNSNVSANLAPLVTYKLSSIRKSGIAGYYQKDSSAHAANASFKNQKVDLKACVQRHAGGPHTATSTKDRVEKILLNKRLF